MTGYVLLYIILAFLLFYFKRRELLRDIVQYAVRFNQTAERLAGDLAIPLVITDWAGSCLWCNKRFLSTFYPEGAKKRFAIDSVISNLTVDTFPQKTQKFTFIQKLNILRR